MPAVLVTGISKGGFGGGLGIVAVPVLALTISPAQAVAILAPILILMDAFGVQTCWRDVDRTAMAVMLPDAVLGVAIGGLMFDLPDARMTRLVVGVLALAFVAGTIIFFAVVILMKLVPYWLIGEFTGSNLATALVLAPLAPISMYLGVWLHHRIKQRLFMLLCYGLVALTGVKLIADGLGV